MPAKYLNYMESTPLEMEEMIKENPIAFVPFGSLEWHGPHNVLGTDSAIATGICKRTIEVTGGVLFPCVNWGAFYTMNFPYTMHFQKKPYIKMTRDMVRQLYEWGFRIIVLFTGHYPGAQIKNVMNAAKWISKKHDDCFAIGIPEQELIPDLGNFGDHAADWETSFMLAMGHQVHLDRLPDNLNYPERAITQGIMGKDPKLYASKEKGEQALNECVKRLSDAIFKVKETRSMEPFEAIYSNFMKFRKDLFNWKKKGNLSKLFESQGFNNRSEAIAFFKWFATKGKKYDPDYVYKEKISD